MFYCYKIVRFIAELWNNIVDMIRLIVKKIYNYNNSEILINTKIKYYKNVVKYKNNIGK